MIIIVAVVTILVFVLGIFIGGRQAVKDFQDKLETAWIELNWTERDFAKLVKKVNKLVEGKK